MPEFEVKTLHQSLSRITRENDHLAFFCPKSADEKLADYIAQGYAVMKLETFKEESEVVGTYFERVVTLSRSSSE